MAAMISSFSGGAVLTSRSVSGSRASASIVGGGLFLFCTVVRLLCAQILS